MKVISRAEVSMLVGVLVVVGSLFGSVFFAFSNNRVRDMVDSDLKAVEDAVLAFYEEYRQLPTLYGEYFDFQYGIDGDVSNHEVMNALMALDAAGNMNHEVNKKQIVYIEIPKAGRGLSGLNDEGVFVDPWGNEYHLVLDTDGNEACALEDTPYPRAVGKRVAIWSKGPDGKLFTWDDMRSWK